MNDMRRTGILVTGAGGFVGRNLTEHLADRYRIFAATHRELDLLDEEAVRDVIRERRIGIILHCAVVGGTRKTSYDGGAIDVVAQNLRMYFNLVRCLEPEMRMIVFGSGAEYDMRHYTPKMREDYFDCHVPADSYGFAKYVIAKHAATYTNVTLLRIFGLYGKYEDYRFKFISNAIVKNLLGLPIVINQNVLFDYLYINDFLRLVEYFVRRQPAERVMNLTPDSPLDLLSLARCINQAGQRPSEIVILNEGMNREYSGG